jgi:hypothetical protein
MKCKSCRKVLEDDAVWCPGCGAETGVIGERFSAKKNLKEDWARFKSTHCYPFAIFYVLALLAPAGALALFTSGNYLLNNLVMLIWTPLLLIPFGMPVEADGLRLTIRGWVSGLRLYPRYFAFVLMAVVYFFLLKVICTGKPLFFFAADPILHLVRLVMVLYGLAIVLPALPLTEMSPFRALWTAYRGGADTRWQQFFLLFILFVINAVAAIPVGLGLLVTAPFTFYAIRSYTAKLTRFTPFKRYLPIIQPQGE